MAGVVCRARPSESVKAQAHVHVHVHARMLHVRHMVKMRWLPSLMNHSEHAGRRVVVLIKLYSLHAHTFFRACMNSYVVWRVRTGDSSTIAAHHVAYSDAVAYCDAVASCDAVAYSQHPSSPAALHVQHTARPRRPAQRRRPRSQRQDHQTEIPVLCAATTFATYHSNSTSSSWYRAGYLYRHAPVPLVLGDLAASSESARGSRA